MDFVSAALADKRHFRVMTVGDVHTREGLALVADTPLSRICAAVSSHHRPSNTTFTITGF